MNAPEGEVTLCKVPWNPDYKHVCQSVMGNPNAIINNWGVSTTNNYTFIRQDSDIKVPYNADDIYGVNYVVYSNNGKQFCCFVTTVTYISNNTTLLHLVEDVWQTWGGDIDWHACFVAREHVDSDEIGEHILPEPAIQFEQECLQSFKSPMLDDRIIIIMTNAVPKFKPGQSDYFATHNKEDFDGSDPVSGDWYNGIMHGARAYGFAESEWAACKNFLNNLQLCGAGESICSCFMMPSSGVTLVDHKVVARSQKYQMTTGNMNFDHACGNGYVPRNKKLLTYPYTYLNVTDHNGMSADFQFEKFGGDGTFSNRNGIRFYLDWILDPTTSVMIHPLTAYKDGGTAVVGSSSLAVQCSWSYGSYNNWVAQHAESNGVKELASLGAVGLGIIAVVAGALLSGTGVGTVGGVPLMSWGIMASGGAAIAGGQLGMRTLNADIDAQSKVPDKTSPSATNNTLYGTGFNNFEFRNIVIREDNASSLDDFFDQFGYEVDVLKVPNVTGRRSWNYVKTVGASVGGDIPADRLAVINECLDAGITFWHTGDVGNYGLGNEIV